MAEAYTGRVCNGVVVLEGQGTALAEGTVVRVEPVADDDPLATTRGWLLHLSDEAEAEAPSLPDDLAEHHDHYAHGSPRP
jgi:hypothetical protein